MTTEIDYTAHMAQTRWSEHPGLDGIEVRVIAGIDARSSDAVGLRMTVMLAASALMIGAVVGGVPGQRAVAATPHGLVEPGPLAPSTLLLGSAAE
ncbi:hypothetical protein [Sphingomonas sp.]|jgi:hypothetical protein|uniref:hypothetical protein n=1 Tax=Sphingomonas sp. TaxID=28214 RepID=UPI002E110044|nr:hypothetical protein [Sphingomonas sp.]